MRIDKLKDLEIVGYNDVFEYENVPRLVKPIFKYKNEDCYIFTPYIIHKDSVIDGVIGDSNDWNRFLNDKISSIESTFVASVDFNLWIDENFKIHYTPSKVAEDNLQTCSRKLSSKAECFLLDSDYDKADVYASKSISANDKNINAWLVLAAMYKLTGETDMTEIVIKDTLSDYIDSNSFDILLDDLLSYF